MEGLLSPGGALAVETWCHSSSMNYSLPLPLRWATGQDQGNKIIMFPPNAELQVADYFVQRKIYNLVTLKSSPFYRLSSRLSFIVTQRWGRQLVHLRGSLNIWIANLKYHQMDIWTLKILRDTLNSKTLHFPTLARQTKTILCSRYVWLSPVHLFYLQFKWFCHVRLHQFTQFLSSTRTCHLS